MCKSLVKVLIKFFIGGCLLQFIYKPNLHWSENMFKLCIQQCFPCQCTPQQKTRKQFPLWSMCLAKLPEFLISNEEKLGNVCLFLLGYVNTFTVTCFHLPVLADLTRLWRPVVIFGISAGVGGVNSTRA